jgi:hypothetical protein
MNQQHPVPGDAAQPHTTPSAGGRADAVRGRLSTGGVLRFVLAVLPFVGMLVLIPFVNRVEPYVLDLPFLLFWIVVWVVLTSACMTVVYFTDPANRTGGQA